MLKATALAASFAVTSIAAPLVAQDADDPNRNITSITVFGDSLVDAGNVNFLNPAVASSANGYFQGRFTNGYDYTDLLSLELFDMPTTASLEGGTNFAFGGARAINTSAVPDLGEQLGIYQGFLAAGGEVDPTGLYVLTFGGNDIFAALQPGSPAGFDSDSAYLMAAANAYAQGVLDLANLGVTNFLITGFPNAVPQAVEANGYLATALGALPLSDGVNVNYFDFFDFFTRLSADPTAFGLPADLDFTTTCQQAQAFPDCTGYFSFDGVHPTAAVQAAAFGDIQSQFGFAAAGGAGAVPEPDAWALMILGFGLAGAAMRRANARRRQTTLAYA
ncbi:PEP-CTERM sorting domain-containing protein [Erythrobacter litoralis]|uniref:SGNH/GDSL hydrolase family protein n=1 Tax=Erythrobacter litoralis TaxID=39960 RepID=UPI002435A37D|nr:SGNH/GDSL hydrolase family protein [Erythrobacter litoralis]MDG6078992.1 PEP-CTERM sorting domain-containing protein [Erythrobacter litoralis]